MLSVQTDEHFMKQALVEAQLAYDAGEVPVGAVIVAHGRIIARSHNLTELLKDVTAHAELQAFTAASDFLGGKYLKGCTLYVTLEPCVMCAGAAYWTQLDKIVIGASDEKRGFRTKQDDILHPRTKLIEGVMAKECSEILTRFFQDRRRIEKLN
ncbi:MAG: nucleoside deaminase [Flavobacteriales bacterium]|nr:nucleoside deaminase [Flavobacteriales bacterium]NNK80225.1 nucleoside deaminase [Flavobacteriales bacterium]